MGASFRSWLNRLPFQDPLTRQHAFLLQGFLLVILAVMIPALPLSLAGGGVGIGLALRFSANIFLLIGVGISFVLLRRGHLQMTVLGIVLSLLITQTLTLVVIGSTVGAGLLLIPFIPLILAGLLSSRRMVIFTLLANVASIALIVILEQQTPPMAGIDHPAELMSVMLIVDLLLVGGICIFFLDRFARAFREALHLARTREEALDQLQQRQAAIIEERTHDLEQSLLQTNQQKQALEATLQALHASQQTVQALSAPLIPVLPGVLVMPLTGHLDMARIAQVTDTLLHSVATQKSRHVIIDVTGLPAIDTTVADGLQRLASTLQLLGADIMLVGIRPEVAQTIVSLGVETNQWRLYADLQAAVRALIAT